MKASRHFRLVEISITMPDNSRPGRVHAERAP